MQEIILPASQSSNLECLYPIFSLIKSGIVLTDSASKILYVNHTYEEISGYSSLELLGNNPGIIRSGYHDKEFYERMWQTLKQNGVWSGEVWNRNKFGHIFPVELTIAKIRCENSDNAYYIGIFNALTMTNSAGTKDINLLVVDLLTKLPTKAAAEDFFTRTVKNIAQAEKDVNNKLVVVFINLDRFKEVNKQYGYLIGDIVLKQFASSLSLLISNTDYLARYEKDHFVLIIPHPIPDEELKELFLRINEEFSAPFYIDGQKIYANCSFGVARIENASQSLVELVNLASRKEL